MRIVFRREEDIVEVERLSDCQQHCHSLEDSDRIKQNSACRSLAASEVAKSYAVAAVSRNLSAVDRPKEQLLLKEAGSHWLSLKDCHNAGAAYKKQNPDTRRQGGLKEWQQQQWEAGGWLESRQRWSGGLNELMTERS